jgi:hypothetical protein
LSPEAAEKADKAHHRELLKRATKAVGLQRHALLLDAGLRAAASGSEVPTLSGRSQRISGAFG